MPRGKGKSKRTYPQGLGYNLRSGRFFAKFTGRYVSEEAARKFSYTEILREEQESYLEELFEVAGDYFDSIEEFRKFAPTGKLKKKEKDSKLKKKEKEKFVSRQFFKKDFLDQKDLIHKEDYDYEYYNQAAKGYGMNVEKEIKKLKKKFSHQTKQRYFYNRDRDLKRESKSIICWLIVTASERGTFMMRLRLGSEKSLSVQQWSKYWTHDRKNSKGKKMPALIDVLRHRILPSIGPSQGYSTAWELNEVIGWHF